MKYLALSIRALIVILPWRIRRIILQQAYGYQFGPGARIGFLSWVFPRQMNMAQGASIGSLNVIIHLERIEMGAHATIGRSNWITGHSHGSRHFTHRLDRDSALILGHHSAITKSHIIDCTDRISIGSFTTIAGYGSQLITHGINVAENRQDCSPLHIGDYCLVGTRVICLGGSRLPDRSVLAAGSTLNRDFEAPETLYAGCPARAVKTLPPDARYFAREVGFVC